MKKRFIAGAILAAILAGCATTVPSPLQYKPEMRRMSCADNRLFRDILNAVGGVGFADETFFPKATVREIVQIKPIIPYNRRGIGVERWTIQHDGGDSCSYIVLLTPGGRRGTTFAVRRETKPE